MSNNNRGTSNIALNLVLWVFVGLFLGYILYVFLYPSIIIQPTMNTTKNATINTTTPTPKTLPSNFSLTLITHKGCKDCNGTFNLAKELSTSASSLSLKFENQRVVDSTSTEGKALISKYNLLNVPTLIVSWEANASKQFVSSWANLGTREKDGAFVLRKSYLYPPYYNLKNKTYYGYVDFIAIEVKDCKNCTNAIAYERSLTIPTVGVVFSNKSVIAHNSTQAKQLINKYNITKLPTFVLSPSAMSYPALANYWSLTEKPESDGWLVYRNVPAPYYSVPNKTIFGLLTMVEIVDKTCTSCYNVSLHEEGLMLTFGLIITNKTQYDVNSTKGKALLNKYNITAVPTIILSSDSQYYTSLKTTWLDMGNTVESDGWYVYRGMDKLSGLTYKNLITGKTTTNPS